MLGGEIVPVEVELRVPDINIPGSNCVLDDKARDDDTVDTEDRNEYMHEQAAAATTIDTETALYNEGKRGPEDDMMKVITDKVCGNDDDPTGDMKGPQN